MGPIALEVIVIVISDHAELISFDNGMQKEYFFVFHHVDRNRSQNHHLQHEFYLRIDYIISVG